MTKKLTHVGVLDSLFGGETKLVNKIHLYEQTVNDIKHEEKIETLERFLTRRKLKIKETRKMSMKSRQQTKTRQHKNDRKIHPNIFTHFY